MKVIVAGSRTFSDRALAFAKLDRILANVGPGECTIVSGGARGADRIGEAYARARGLKCEVFPADWAAGRGAGYERNQRMAAVADALVAFWDGESRGTADMIRLMQTAGKPVRVVRFA